MQHQLYQCPQIQLSASDEDSHLFLEGVYVEEQNCPHLGMETPSGTQQKLPPLLSPTI